MRGTWNSGIIATDCSIAIIRHRTNIRASERNRPNFPKTGHYDHYLFDEIQAFLVRLGLPLLDWWPQAAYTEVNNETFGVAPTFPPYQHESLLEANLLKLPSGYRYIARKTGFCPPFLPVQTPEEMKLYKAAIGNVSSFQQFANDWNDGTLFINRKKGSLAPTPGNNIFRKTAEDMERYHKFYLAALDKRNARATVGLDLIELRQEFNDPDIPTFVDIAHVVIIPQAPLPTETTRNAIVYPLATVTRPPSLNSRPNQPVPGTASRCSPHPTTNQPPSSLNSSTTASSHLPSAPVPIRNSTSTQLYTQGAVAPAAPPRVKLCKNCGGSECP
ncbi:hypothetical protein HDU76_009500, partial [Blyttiomyces sp. JEL0837]